MLAASLDMQSLIGIAVDAVLVLLLVIFLVLGIKKGLVKMCRGLISSVLVIVIAVVAVTPLTSVVIDKTKWDNNLSSKLEESMSSKIPNPYAVIYYADTDEDPETPDELMFDAGEGELPYDQIFNGNILGTLGLHKIMKPLIVKSLTGDTTQVFLITGLTTSITYIIFLVVIFIILLIIARILISIVFYLLKRMVSSLYVANFIDKFVGAILGVAVGALVVLCLITILQLMQSLSFMEPVNAAIENSYITKFVTEHNFLYTFVSSKVSLTALLNK